MAEEGHVFAPFGYLEHQFRAALEMEPELAGQALGELSESGEVVNETVDDYPAAYLKRLHEAEVTVADRIRLLTAGRPMASQAAAPPLTTAPQITRYPPP